MRRQLTSLAASLVLAGGLTACSRDLGGPGSADQTGTQAATAGTPTASATHQPEAGVTPTATATFPSDRVGNAMRWFVGQMNSDRVEADLGKRFAQEFTDQVPPEQVLILIGELRMQGPWVTEDVRTDGDDGVATLVSGQGMRLTLSMQLDEDGLIAGALIDSADRSTPAPS